MNALDQERPGLVTWEAAAEHEPVAGRPEDEAEPAHRRHTRAVLQHPRAHQVDAVSPEAGQGRPDQPAGHRGVARQEVRDVPLPAHPCHRPVRVTTKPWTRPASATACTAKV